MVQERKILKAVTEKYGSVNGCWEKAGKDSGISRTNFYALMSYETPNPGVWTLMKLSEIAGLPLEETIDDYLAGHRDLGSRDRR